MARDRDLLGEFDAVLPRLETYGPRAVPAAGAKEYAEHQRVRDDRRTDLAVLGGASGILAFMTWLLWMPWIPLWLLVPMAVGTGLTGAAAARRFLQLAFGQRLEQALPAGTDAATAQLEDGTWSLVRHWNADAFVWNQAVEALRLEVIEWRRLENVPEARDVEWTASGSAIRAQALFAAIRGLVSERSGLVARRDEIDHRLRSLDARLHQLKAANEAFLSLPAPADEDPTDDG